MELIDAKIDFWIKNNLNVLMTGKYGVGKTAQIINGFNRHKLKWKYYSTPTMDPWTDFIGTPEKVIENKDGKDFKYLDFIQPRDIAEDEVEAFYFDEFNRGRSKIRDAVLELIQFKSINGKPFKKLRMIWAAINPETIDGSDQEYFVEKLDPAQRDRFQVHVNIDYKPSEEYFSDKFGEIGTIGCEWWDNLPEQSKDNVSPRRLEYALSMFNMGGDVKDILPADINVPELVTQLENGSFITRLKNLYFGANKEETQKALKNENFYNGAIAKILTDEDYLNYFSQYLPSEKFSNLLLTDEKFKTHIFSSEEKCKLNLENLTYIIDANVINKKMIKEIKDTLKKYNLWKEESIDSYIQKYYDMFTNGEVDTTERMRITSLVHQTEIKDIQHENLVKVNVVMCLIISQVQAGWEANRISIGKIKDQAENLGGTYRTLYEESKKDPLFIKKVQSATVKLENKLAEYGVL